MASVGGVRSDALTSVAKDLVADRDPGVAFGFAQWGAAGFESAQVIDRMVLRLADKRAVDDNIDPITARSSLDTVGAGVLEALRAEFVVRRVAFADERPAALTDGATQLAAWWKERKHSWSAGPMDDGWIKVIDRRVRVTDASPVRVEGESGSGGVWIKLEGYAEACTASFVAQNGVLVVSEDKECDAVLTRLRFLGAPTGTRVFAGGANGVPESGARWAVVGSAAQIGPPKEGVTVRIRLWRRG